MTVRINPPTFMQRQCAERVFGVFDHARTLREWRNRFVDGIDRVAKMGFDRSFQRKRVYHLSSCEAAFDTGYLGDLQMVMVKSEIGY